MKLSGELYVNLRATLNLYMCLKFVQVIHFNPVYQNFANIPNINREKRISPIIVVSNSSAKIKSYGIRTENIHSNIYLKNLGLLEEWMRDLPSHENRKKVPCILEKIP